MELLVTRGRAHVSPVGTTEFGITAGREGHYDHDLVIGDLTAASLEHQHAQAELGREFDPDY